MMGLLQNDDYLKDIQCVASLPLRWNELNDKTILISGGTGAIGTFLIDVLMYRNDINCHVIVIGRNEKKAYERLLTWWNDSRFTFVNNDINDNLVIDRPVNYIIHAASNTHPHLYSRDPIGTIKTNTVGTLNLLELAKQKKTERFVFLSSVEIYGESLDDNHMFGEKYCGYIDCNTLRAGYPESKRCGEAICQAYIMQNNLDIVIPRLARTYGPTLLEDDSKAISQFLHNGMNGENIILKSSGNQFYSYSYVADAASAILTILFYGECGEAYNVADISSNITLRELAELIAGYSHSEVVYELPDDVEKNGYSKATRAVMDSTKLYRLGWKPEYDIKKGVKRTLDILKWEKFSGEK